MLPITSLLSCPALIDEFECFLTRQKHHAKTYVTGLVAASNKTVDGIATHVLPAKSERALNKFLTEYEWDTDQLSTERLALLQRHNETNWSREGVVLIDSVWESASSGIPQASHGVIGVLINCIYCLVGLYAIPLSPSFHPNA
jgi:hypothetical protein